MKHHITKLYVFQTFKLMMWPWCMAVVLFSPSLWSAGASGVVADREVASHGRLSPLQVTNQASDMIGAYGGLATTINARGETESVFIVISKKGYMTPITVDGEIAAVGELFYSEENCMGREYIAPAKGNYTLQPMGGVIYKSPVTLELKYISKFQGKEEHKLGSRLIYDNGSTPFCMNQPHSMDVFPTMRNSLQATGFAPTGIIGSIAIMDQSQNLPKKPDRGESGAKPQFNKEYLGETSQSPTTDDECSTACFMSDIGNGTCDISCNVAACSFDGEDCSDLSEEEIESESAKYCSPGCLNSSVGDGFCDSACDNASCSYDGDDCSSN